MLKWQQTTLFDQVWDVSAKKSSKKDSIWVQKSKKKFQSFLNAIFIQIIPPSLVITYQSFTIVFELILFEGFPWFVYSLIMLSMI